jgi:lysyl-tRNA synthetase class 2
MSDSNSGSPDQVVGADDNKLIAERRAKLDKIRETRNAFPNDFRRDALADQLLTA